MGLLFVLIDDRSIGIGSSRHALFWCRAGILLVGLVGALLGFFFLPATLPIPLRVLFGAVIGLFGLGVLLSVLADPKAALNELALTGCLEGCCVFHLVLFSALIGTVSGFLLWHSLLLEGLAGGADLITVLLFRQILVKICRHCIKQFTDALWKNQVGPCFQRGHSSPA